MGNGNYIGKCTIASMTNFKLIKLIHGYEVVKLNG